MTYVSPRYLGVLVIEVGFLQDSLDGASLRIPDVALEHNRLQILLGHLRVSADVHVL